MPPIVALATCAVVILFLLWTESKRNPDASVALWVPTIWMLISGSRPVGRWFATDIGGDVDYEAGSLPDRLVLTGLTLLAVVIVFRRKIRWSSLLRENFWLLAFFGYMGLSILWVDNPFVSLKRWIRSASPIAMAVVIASEAAPRIALESILRRCAYVLVPLSFVLIKYYPLIGRAYGRWDGLEMWTGATTHKNSLGQMCAVSAFFLVWSLLRRGRGQERTPTRIDAFADWGTLLLIGYLLRGPGTYSATSISITVVGLAIFLALRKREALAMFVTRNLKILVIVTALFYAFLAEPATAAVTSLMGRSKNLTGRATDIWPVVLQAAAEHPLLGVGYGGAWGLGTSLSATVGVEQAHNGYLDVYLQLGILGVILLAGFLLGFCTVVRKCFQRDQDWAIFGTAFLFMTVLYNLSETAFFDVYLGTTMTLLPIVLSALGTKNSVVAAVQQARVVPHRWRLVDRNQKTHASDSNHSDIRQPFDGRWRAIHSNFRTTRQP